jgi:hypothetical protein
MCYRRAYSYGNNPTEALIFLKVNEIGYGSIIKQTKYYIIDKPDDIRCKKFELYLNLCINHDCKREKTKSENKAYNYLTSVYGYNKFKKIMSIYTNNNSDITICYIDKELSNKLKCYRFLY